MFFISQLGEQDCAFACLKMMLANYHRDKNYLFLSPPSDKLSFQDVISLGKEYSLNLIGVKVENVQELYKCKKFPIVVTLKKRGEKHSVLVTSANSRHVTYFDPVTGKRKVSTEIFVQEWTNRALIVDMNEFQKKKCDQQFPDFVSKRDKITLPILQLLSGLCLVIGTYFLTKESLYFIPIIFLSLFLILEVTFRYSLIGAMRRMDENIFGYKFKDGLKYSEIYKDIEKYRVSALSTTPNFINCCLIVLFISIVLVMNSAYNSIYVLLAMLLSILEVYAFKPYFDNRSAEVGERESEILEVENDFQFRAKSNEIHDLAYQLGLNQSIYGYIEIALLLFTIVLTMILSGVINITYVVFFLCISVFLKSNFTKIMKYSTEAEDLDYVRAKLISSLKEEEII